MTHCYRISLQELSKYLPQIDLDQPVLYCNFTISWSTWDSHCVYKERQPTTNFLNWFLAIKNVNYKSMFIWVSNDVFQILTDKYYIPSELFFVFDI